MQNLSGAQTLAVVRHLPGVQLPHLAFTKASISEADFPLAQTMKMWPNLASYCSLYNFNSCRDRDVSNKLSCLA